MVNKKPIRTLFLILLLISIVAFIFFLSYKEILRKTANYLIYEEPLAKCDTIIILAGEFPDRTVEAGDLYNKGYSRYIIVPNEIENPGFLEIRKRNISFKGPNEWIEDLLMTMGVPKQSIIHIKTFTDRTVEEATAVKDIINSRNDIKCLIVLTSKYHSLRAHKIFKRVLKRTGIKLISRVPKFDDYNPNDWWKKPKYVRNTINEYLKLLTMLFY